jgi:transposase-like protein
MTSINEQERKLSALRIISDHLTRDVYTYCMANNYINLTDSVIDKLLDTDEYTVISALSDIKIDIATQFLNTLINTNVNDPYAVVEAKNHAIHSILPEQFNEWIMYNNLESRDLDGFRMMAEYKFKINKEAIRQYCQYDIIISLLRAFINIEKIHEFVSNAYLLYNDAEFIQFIDK